METILNYIKQTYAPSGILVYGSYANGTSSETSDFDALVITERATAARDNHTVVGGVLLGMGEAASALGEVGKAFAEMGELFAEELGTGFMPLVCLNGLLSIAASVFMLYFSIALACMLTKKYRLLVGIGCYYGINMVFSTVSGAFSMVMMLVSGMLTDPVNASGFMTGMMLVSLILLMIETVLCYIGTKWIMEKKINLD